MSSVVFKTEHIILNNAKRKVQFSFADSRIFSINKTYEFLVSMKSPPRGWKLVQEENFYSFYVWSTDTHNIHKIY